MDFRRKTATMIALLLLACLVQAWMISRAVVPAQDSVRYLIVAQGFERDGLIATLRNQPEQPLFPALVWLVHRMLPCLGWPLADGWAISLQIGAAIPLMLSIVPVYLLFCRLHGERAALIAILLYSLLGGIARLGADGLSDSTHLALFMFALWCVSRYFAVTTGGWGKAAPEIAFGNDLLPRRRGVAGTGASPASSTLSWWNVMLGLLCPSHRATAGPGAIVWLLAAGIFTGPAIMARSEALVLPVALLATLALLPLTRARREWKEAAVGAATFALALAVVLVPYLASCGAANPTAILARLLGRGGAAEAAPLNDSRSAIQATAVEPRWELPGIGRLAFGKKDTSTSSRFRGYGSAAFKLGEELAQTLHYWLGALALVGLWSARRRPVSPLDRFMQCLCATLILAGVTFAAHAGYLSTRHILLLVVLGIGWAGYGTIVVADWLASLFAVAGAGPRWTGQSARWFCRGDAPVGPPPGHRWPLARFGRNQSNLASSAPATVLGAFVTAAVTAALVFACAADCLAPLHASREAHRQAAGWLKGHAARWASVLDSRGWTALYTGLKTYRYEAAQAAFGDPALAYVVVEQAELESSSRRGETMRLLLGHAGETVARFAAAESAKHSVVIYRWRPERFQQLGVQSYAR